MHRPKVSNDWGYEAVSVPDTTQETITATLAGHGPSYKKRSHKLHIRRSVHQGATKSLKSLGHFR